MRFNQSLHKQAIKLVAVPLIFELLFVGGLVYMVQDLESELAKETHYRDVVDRLNRVLYLMTREGIAGVMNNLKRNSAPDPSAFDPSALEGVATTSPTSAANPYALSIERRGVEDEIKAETAALKKVVAGKPEEEALFNEIYASIMAAIDTLRHVRDQETSPLLRLQQMTHMRNSLRRMFPLTDKLILQMSSLAEREHQESSNKRLFLKIWLAVGVLSNILIAVLMAYSFNRGTTKRLDVLMDNSHRLASGQELSAPVEGSDEIARLDHVFHDMALWLEEANKKERAIVENATEVICSISSDGRFSGVNKASMKVWGYSADDLVGTRISKIICPEDIDTTLVKMKQIALDKSSLTFENKVVKRDGTLAHMEWNAQWSEKALFCVIHDITARKQIDQLKADFVAMVSHDLRTPLTSVQGFLELLGAEAYGQLNEDGYDSLEMTEANVQRLIRLINDLLDIEKMESGMLELHVTPTDMFQIIKRSIESVTGFAQQQGIKLVLPTKEKYPLEADGDRLVQVVVNLVSNAVKFSPKGESVYIACESKGNRMRITVTDHGRGVPANMRESIFERFKQVELNDERKKGGSGLGLAICKAIVERHGGSIGVDPGADGVGSVFWFILPLAEAVEAAQPMQKTH